MLRLGFLRRDRAARLGTKSRSRMAVSMVSRVVRATFCGWFRTSETVWKLTPARRATSLIVVWPIVTSRAGLDGRAPRAALPRSVRQSRSVSIGDKAAGRAAKTAYSRAKAAQDRSFAREVRSILRFLGAPIPPFGRPAGQEPCPP